MLPKKLFCLMGQNGAGKTSLVKELIKRYHSKNIKVFDDQTWPILKNKKRRMVVIGEYEQAKAVCGADTTKKDWLWVAILKLSQMEGFESLLVEAQKFSNVENFSMTQRICNAAGLELVLVMVYADPTSCRSRILGSRDEPAEYDMRTIMRRLAQCNYNYHTFKGQKFKIENTQSLEKSFNNLSNLVWSKHDT